MLATVLSAVSAAVLPSAVMLAVPSPPSRIASLSFDNGTQILWKDESRKPRQLDSQDIQFRDRRAGLTDLVPAKDGVFSVINALCNGILQDGHLTDCFSVDIQSSAGLTKAQARAIISSLLVSKAISTQSRDILTVQLVLTVSNSVSGQLNGPCINCIPTPPPPPPPTSSKP